MFPAQSRALLAIKPIEISTILAGPQQSSRRLDVPPFPDVLELVGTPTRAPDACRLIQLARWRASSTRGVTLGRLMVLVDRSVRLRMLSALSLFGVYAN